VGSFAADAVRAQDLRNAALGLRLREILKDLVNPNGRARSSDLSPIPVAAPPIPGARGRARPEPRSDPVEHEVELLPTPGGPHREGRAPNAGSSAFVFCRAAALSRPVAREVLAAKPPSWWSFELAKGPFPTRPGRIDTHLRTIRP